MIKLLVGVLWKVQSKKCRISQQAKLNNNNFIMFVLLMSE